MLHQTTQRRISRAAFLAVCVLPTLCLASWVVWRVWPGQQTALLARVSQQVGASIAAEQITTPMPGRWRAENVSLADRETGAVFATIDWLEYASDSTSPRITGGRFELKQASDAGRWLEFGLSLNGSLDWPTGLQARFESLDLGDAADRKGVAARLTAIDGKPGKRLEMISGTGEARTQMILERGQATTQFLLNTGSQPIAWQLIRGLVANAPSLGDTAQFTGELSVTDTAEQSTGTLHGRIDQATLAPLLGESFGLTLSQPNSVAIQELAWQDNRFTTIAASLDAGSGTASRILLLAANQFLQCDASQRLQTVWPSNADQPIRFDRLALRINIDDAGVTLVGDCPAGGLLAEGGEPLLLSPPSGPQPITALLRLASPEAPVELPATVEANAMANRLPTARVR